MGNFWNPDEGGGGGGVEPGPIVGSGLTLPAETLAGNATGATAGIQAIELDPTLAFVGGKLAATGGLNFAPLVVNTTGDRSGTWSFVRSIPPLIDNGDGTVTGDINSKWVRTFDVPDQPDLDSVEFVDLAGVDLTSPAILNSFRTAVTIGFPALSSYYGNFGFGFPFGSPNMPNLTHIDFSGMQVVQGYIDWYGVADMPLVEEVDLSGLITITAYIALRLPSVLQHNLASLKTAAFLVFENSPVLTTVETPVLERLTQDAGNGNSLVLEGDTMALTTWLCPSTLLEVHVGIKVTAAAFDEASVDSWLVRLAAMDGTLGTVSYDNQTIQFLGGCAPPGAAGLAAIPILEARGNTVLTN